jgi:hypothetical protein
MPAGLKTSTSAEAESADVVGSVGAVLFPTAAPFCGRLCPRPTGHSAASRCAFGTMQILVCYADRDHRSVAMLRGGANVALWAS